MSGVRGDFSALQHVRNGLQVMGSGRFAQELRARIAAAAVTLVTDEFRTGRDPYGRQWKPSARSIAEGGQPLRSSGRLLQSFSSQPNGTGFVIGTNVKYAAIHQYGGIIRAKNGKYLKFRVGGFRAKGQKSVAGAGCRCSRSRSPSGRSSPRAASATAGATRSRRRRRTPCTSSSSSPPCP
jgi:phage gpG-like protein